jgi:hypothetical protein
MKEFKKYICIQIKHNNKMGWNTMLEPHSDEEMEFLRYLLKKYIPGLKSQGKEMPSIMFEQNTFDKIKKKE